MKTRRKESSPRDADAARVRIFEAAKIRFSHGTYEGVGLRDIASDAGVDPALVIRYFGSKEALFDEIAAQAFGTEEFLSDGISALPENAAGILMFDANDEAWRSGYDPLRLLLASIGSPTAGPILAKYLEMNFIQPLSDAVARHDAAERGMIVASLITGFALLRVSAAMTQKDALDGKALRGLLVKTLSCAIG